MATLKLPMTVNRLKRSLDSDKIRKYGAHVNMLRDNTDDNGTIEFSWQHADFIFIKMVIAATRERVTGDVHDTLVFDLLDVLEVTVSGIKRGGDAGIKDLHVDDIKAPVNAMLEVWNNLNVRLHSITTRSPNNTNPSSRTYLAIAL